MKIRWRIIMKINKVRLSVLLVLSAFTAPAFSNGQLGGFEPRTDLPDITFPNVEEQASKIQQSISDGVFFDSTSASGIAITPSGATDLCGNLDGVQTSLPPDYVMVSPGYCRKPCYPVSGKSVQVTSCLSHQYSNTGYVVHETDYIQTCTSPYGTRSIQNNTAFNTTAHCAYKQFGDYDFTTGFGMRLSDSGATASFGIQFGFTDLTPNKYSAKIPSPEVRYTSFTAYKSCNNPYKIREVVIGATDSIKADPITGPTVTNHWYKSSVSDSNCTKVNFAGPLYLYENSQTGTPEMARMTLRGLGQTKKALVEASNGYQITAYNISGQQVVYCFGKIAAGFPVSYNHYSGCKNRLAYKNTPVYFYVDGYTEPVFGTPPEDVPAPELEDMDPFEVIE